MCYLTEYVLIMVSIVIVIDGEHQFLATTDTSRKHAFHSSATDRLNVNHNPPENSLLSVNKYKENLSIKSENIEILKKPISVPVTVTNLPHLFEYNDTLQKLNNNRSNRKRYHSSQLRQKQQPLNDGQGKFLNLFEVVQFEHVTCTSSSGLEGTCLHEYECQNAGGSFMGPCADGYGTCCVIQFECDARFSSPVGWFTNPDFPAPTTERISCTITLDKSSADIHQIRIDFLNFELLPPTSGTCADDQFLVSGQNVNTIIPTLCGINTGQHVYIEVGKSDVPIILCIQTLTTEKRLYALKVTQLSTSHELSAPKGCLQYYKDDNEYLESFNYRDDSDIDIPRYPGYLNNLNYAICIDRAATSCSITYTNAGELQIPNYDTDGLPIIPPRQAGVEIFNCPSDWLLISAIRLCGERLNDGSVLQDFSLDAPVTDTGAGPIVILFRSDSGHVGRGFKLYYVQNNCSLVT